MCRKATYIWKVHVRIQNLKEPLRWAFHENSQQKTVSWKPFTIFGKSSILEVWDGFEYNFEVVMKKPKINNFGFVVLLYEYQKYLIDKFFIAFKFKGYHSNWAR